MPFRGPIPSKQTHSALLCSLFWPGALFHSVYTYKYSALRTVYTYTCMCLESGDKEIYLYINIWSEPLGRGIQLWKGDDCSWGRRVQGLPEAPCWHTRLGRGLRGFAACEAWEKLAGLQKLSVGLRLKSQVLLPAQPCVCVHSACDFHAFLLSCHPLRFTVLL